MMATTHALFGVALAAAALVVAPEFGTVALHAASDALGGGLELKPWRATSERAVYDHFRGRWIRPRRWVRYDGAPEDLAFAGILAGSLLLYAEGAILEVVLAF